jgi:hypothetical protein
MSTMVRVDDKLHATLREISEAERRPIGQIIEEAVKRYQREKFWHGVRQDFARLRSDSGAWQEYQAEIALLQGGSLDGLEREEPYYTPEEEDEIRAEHAQAQRG